MKMRTDLDLLGEYAHGSEKAFAALVARHLDLVYSAAMRQVRSSQLAEDIAQSVFTDLARNVHQLKPDTVLAAWLYQVTRRTALNVSRSEGRRLAREQIAVELADMNATSSDWTQIEPWLDEAMETLEEPDRAAILLRYFENKSLRDVGETLGVGEDAAQKRVSRAVERLREFFSKRNVTIGASGLAVLISANAVQAAPVGLIGTISTAVALIGTTFQTSTAIAATKTIAMTTIQKTLIVTLIAIATGVGIYEAQRASNLQKEIQSLQEQSPLAGQIQELKRGSEDSARQLAALREENERLNRNTSELLKLRGEIGRLRKDSLELAQLKTGGQAENNPAAAAMKLWLARVKQLKQRLEESPDQRIPELQFLKEQDWLNATKGELDTEKDYRRAMSAIRQAAESRFGDLLQPALKKYIEANEGRFPTDMNQLQPYFKTPVGEAVLDRYEILPAEILRSIKVGGDWVITQKAPVDEDYDSRMGMGPNGWGSSGGSGAWSNNNDPLIDAYKSLSAVRNNYKAEHKGNDSAELSQLQPYLKTPQQQAALEKLMQAEEKTKAKLKNEAE